MNSLEPDSALMEWAALLGPDHVTAESADLRSAETATFATRQRISAILFPGNKDELKSCLRIANRFKVPVHPISSGKNWGYGSRVPAADRSVLIDLRRMNRILDFSESLAYVTVEPGVTQGQVYKFLQDRGSRLWIDATGASPDSSLIGNTMERGFGHTPYGDHFAHVCGLEIMLANGEVIETGAARFPGAASAAVNRWGLGPSIDGLFSQSNLGIVTRMTVFLMPAPERFEAFFFRIDDPDGLPALIDALRPLRMQEVLRSAMHIANDYKVLGGLRQYPWQETGGRTPLTPDLMAKFRKDLTFGAWNASGGLYGTPRQVAEAKRLLRKALAPLRGHLNFVSPRLLHFAKRFATPFKMISGWDIRRTVELVEPVVDLMRGIPTSHALGSCYWRKRTPIPALNADPDRDRCGLLWYSPVAPSEGMQVQVLARIAIDTMLEFGFEPMLSLTILQPRTVWCVTSITYDRDVAGEDDRALRCYHELAARCTKAGYYPYRLGTQSMDEDHRRRDPNPIVAVLRSAFDPNQILAPGRYES